MTTQQPEGVAFEQKTLPVPSSGKMALDLDINGNSNRDETITHNHVDAAPAPEEVALTKSVAISSDDAEVYHNTAAVNGFANAEAFSDNQASVAPAVDMSAPAVESQPTDDASSALNSSQLPDANTTTTEEMQPSTMPDAGELDASSGLLASADSAIESAVEDVTAPSTVPPVVEAPESDLRNELSPLAHNSDIPLADEQAPMDFDFDIPANLPQGDNIADRTAGADLSDLGLAGNIPDLPDFSADNQSLPQSSTNLATGGSPSPLIEQDDVKEWPLDDTMADSAPEAAPEAAAVDPVSDSVSDSMQPPKIARVREDDDENEPSAKRTKTEETALDQEMADVPPAPASNSEQAAAQADSDEITEYQAKQIVKVLKNVARTKDGKNFRAPVSVLWPIIAEAYLQKISNPIDLGTMETNLLNSHYPNLEAFKDDARLLASNASLFNGPDHLVTHSARSVRDSLFKKIEDIPAEPAPPPKKEKKVKKEPATDIPARPAARRLSRGASTNAVQPSAHAAQTFALDPSTSMPLIRRDSTKGEGGRPKREIHPPKNKDLPYSIARPKNKKFATELKFCKEVMKELWNNRYSSFASIFYLPVDPVALGIPTYFNIIKSPMDLTTVGAKLEEGRYATAKDFEKDMQLMIGNCLKFNPPGNPVRDLGLQFEKLFKSQWANKQQWVAAHSPAPASVGSADSDEEDSEEDEEEATSNAGPSGMSQAASRLIEEQGKLIEMMKSKTANQDMITLQQQLIDLIDQQVKKESARESRPLKKPKKAKSQKSKKPVPTRKAPSASSKKSSNSSKQKYMGTLEKEVISAGIGNLPDAVSTDVLTWIRNEQPGVDAGDDGTLELDIDMISAPTLWKIYNLIQLHAPEIGEDIRASYDQRDTPREPAKPASKKKNKPMSKNEQEQKIELLKNRANEFARQASGSEEPVYPSIEPSHNNQSPESSGDEDSDSEEE
ncbi:Bromodomain-containing factor protein [Lachnellula suecica]|uniref:Bromodomain-containing factor protein n=1 Tax=Lachnellula suecica TaxID=602035 RepID=A0A8T9C7I9_9HELO|nr:Bromodomain-containing factor protein [Lachnellula suecica]